MSLVKINSVRISLEANSNLMAIDVFKESWKNKEKTISATLLNNLRNIGAFESIGSSNRIEGNTLSDKEVEELLQGLKTESFRSRDEEEVVGYSEVLDTIYNNFESIQLSENYIKQLHGILLRYTGKDERHRGEYKKLENSVAAFDNTGKEIGIVFKTASPFDTPLLMKQLVDETNELFDSKLYPPLIIIALFIVHFLAIHPFQDGNGRLSRLLTNFLLIKYGYSYIQYYSLEKLIEESKSSYYRALRKTQITFQTDDYDYSPWLDYFSMILKKQTVNLEKKIAAYEGNDALSPDEERILLSIRNSFKGLQYGAIKRECPDLGDNTIRRILRKLSSLNLIEKHGTGKGMWYGPNLRYERNI